MDLSELASKLGLTEPKHIVRKAAELRRMSDLQFDSSNAGIGEICKAVICLEIAANMKQALFDRQTAIRYTCYLLKSHSKIVDIEKVAVSSSI
uniref:Origin of replication complex subunit 6 n=1 Tax=Tanacetum cinerariifolium TaxID=118510 RepID=A0A6L2LJ20_TANCI|nr:origin of replication complex subunit 6 [Tanacetum cinerariifolium]